MLIDPEQVCSYLTELQQSLCQDFLALDTKGEFQVDTWKRAEGGGGQSNCFVPGKVFEKGGVNFSDVYGASLPPAATVRRPELAGRSFRAMGVSLVFHPYNPYCPTAHMNVRFFWAEAPEQEPVWWFGGGFDLTPYYGFAEDACHWHRCAKTACQAFGEERYTLCKAACDRYFYLPHRKEQRGIGGLFFDDYSEGGFERCFSFMQSVAEHFMPGYSPIIQRRHPTRYTQRERDFQCYRRGRYTEFNLLYDRGTRFGLESKGRTESILMSLPPKVLWRYDWQPDPGSPEAELTDFFLVPRDWLKT